ncbi:transketolase [Pseudobythopirellula maris]|uniref:transketolase n=1 Tax=Pseudobythopirellula maris TaxID=2527991 RepID=UPI001E329A0B|nr:transketolase [Pseudobythopirellula maris]
MTPSDRDRLEDLCRLMRTWILESTHAAGSGHPTSSLSAVELMAGLFFTGQLHYDPSDPDYANNDRVIFSKGHASPLLYALWAAADQIDEDDLLTYRDFNSPLEGHPTRRFELAEAATGSLGQGLSIGVGKALSAKRLDRLPCRTYVLLGDSEMAEGSQWEAVQIAAHYGLDNLVGLLDVNRLGQRGPTQFGHDLRAYQQRLEAFGWNVELVEDGHDLERVETALAFAQKASGRPTMVVAKTLKGRGVSFLEDEEGWHGKALDEDQLKRALDEIGGVDRSLRGEIARPERIEFAEPAKEQPAGDVEYALGDQVATRDGYGSALCRIAPLFPGLVALDGEVSNSTRAKAFREEHPDRFFEMFIAEQNMAGVALGMALRGKTPFVSTFAAFLTRAFDQVRMSVHSGAGINFVGSHAGVSIGQDGPSQMGLEDLAMFRLLPGSTVLYPSDAVSTERLVEAMAREPGVCYLRTTRGDTPVIYEGDEEFPIGGCKVLRHSDRDIGVIVAAGVTLHEALAAHDTLRERGVAVRVIDLYSVKPLDAETLRLAAEATGFVLTVEDHYPEGGLGEAVASALADHPAPVFCMAVDHRPRSGEPERLRDEEGISANAIVNMVSNLASTMQPNFR